MPILVDDFGYECVFANSSFRTQPPLKIGFSTVINGFQDERAQNGTYENRNNVAGV